MEIKEQISSFHFQLNEEYFMINRKLKPGTYFMTFRRSGVIKNKEEQVCSTCFSQVVFFSPIIIITIIPITILLI